MRYPVPVLLLLVAFVACSKNNNNGSSSGSFTASIGTTSYTGTTTLAAYSYGLGELAIVSYGRHPNDTSAFQVNMRWPAKVFNQALPADSLLSILYAAKGKEYNAYSTEGQVQLTLTSVDSIGHKIAGSFTAIGHSSTDYNDSVVITNGKFSTSYNVNP